ncbi:protocatechuate 3,4-dioxygenase subunit alpha [Herbidospora sp. RD11066]
MRPTPSQTVGPFYGYALPFRDGGDLVPPGHPGAISVHGYVYDGAGDPVPDALLEFWQADEAGKPGSMRRDEVDGSFAGRDGVTLTGFGRVATDLDGHWAVRTVRPREVPYIAVCVFARGLLHHLYTRIYLEDSGDALLESLPGDRRSTLVARSERDGVYRFDIRIQGDAETVFLDLG